MLTLLIILNLNSYVYFPFTIYTFNEDGKKIIIIDDKDKDL
jgi:hypothetical protein